MIVCSCNVFSDRDVESAVAGAAQRPRVSQVYASLSCSAKCGRCTHTVKRIMDEIWASLSEPAAAARAEGTRLEHASAFGTADAFHPRPKHRVAGCPSPWRQGPAREPSGPRTTWNCLPATSQSRGFSLPGAALREPSPPSERKTINRPLYERGVFSAVPA
jgi:bacterioferritin-associated ferredoxin